MSILDSKIMQRRKKDVEDVIYNNGEIGLYDLKLSFGVNKTNPLVLKREKIINNFSIEILNVCNDQNMTFVVNPKYRLQTTKHGGNVSLLCLEKGYELKNLEYYIDSQLSSGEIGLTAQEAGVNLKLTSSIMNKFKVSTGELTHDHLVLITNAKIHKNVFKTKFDSAEIVIDYVTIAKKHEQELVRAINRKREEAYKY
jgi:hypothetical protein